MVKIVYEELVKFLGGAGSKIDITGHVDRLTNQCKGVKYQCRFSYDAKCEVKKGALSSDLVCNKCDSSDKKLYCIGEKKGGLFSGWLGAILGIIAAIVVSAVLAELIPGIIGTITGAIGGTAANLGLSRATGSGAVPVGGGGAPAGGSPAAGS